MLTEKLCKMRTAGRMRLEAIRACVSGRDRAERDTVYRALVRRLEEDMPTEMIAYCDVTDIATKPVSCRLLAWITFHLPGSWPLVCAYRRTPAPECWVRELLDRAPAEDGGDTLWQIAKHSGDVENARLIGANSLEVALALAEMTELERDEEREKEAVA